LEYHVADAAAVKFLEFPNPESAEDVGALLFQ
jgi:hypothetical protein